MSKRLHILVVEDDQDLRETLMEALEQEGYAVTPARDGVDALSQLRNAHSRPDLILLDLQMPRMNGVEFRGEQLKIKELADIPVAILTADTEGEQKAASLKTAFLRKPLKLPQLLSAIPQVMRRAPGTLGEGSQ
jgi:two-component system, chemotaxis family, chemotaxis protein CheY